MKQSESISYTLQNGGTSTLVDNNNLRHVVLSIRAVEHELRKRIIRMLMEKEEMTVTEIYVKLRIEQSVASQHLAILRNAGIVDTIREGKFILYALDKDKLDELAEFIDALI